MTASRRRRGPGGFALIVVLFVTAVLLIVVLEFAHSMQVYATVGANGFHDVRLRGALHGGLATAQRLLLEDLLTDVDNDVDMDHLEENWAGEAIAIRLEGVSATVTLVDEAGKFPLSTLVTYQIEDNQIVRSIVDPTRRRQLHILFEELDLEPELVDVVVDWLDVDDDPEPDGAEHADYLRLKYACRNGPLTSIDELELLRGFTHEMVWGDPDDDDVLGLADVCSVTPRADNRVNANTAPEPVLLALVPEEDLAHRIAQERRRDPFVDDADLGDRVGDSRVTTYLTTASGRWQVQVEATTDHEQRPLTMQAHGLLSRTRENPDEEGATRDNADALALGQPARAAGGEPENLRGVVRVVAWKEWR